MLQQAYCKLLCHELHCFVAVHVVAVASWFGLLFKVSPKLCVTALSHSVRFGAIFVYVNMALCTPVAVFQPWAASQCSACSCAPQLLQVLLDQGCDHVQRAPQRADDHHAWRLCVQDRNEAPHLQPCLPALALAWPSLRISA